MKNRLVRLAVMVFLALLAGAAALWLIAAFWATGPNRPGISFENFEKIRAGMPKKQVEAILGGPPRWEISGELPEEAALYCVGNVVSPAEWWGRRGVISVYYDNHGLVSEMSFAKLPFEVDPPRPWDFLLFRAR